MTPSKNSQVHSYNYMGPRGIFNLSKGSASAKRELFFGAGQFFRTVFNKLENHTVFKSLAEQPERCSLREAVPPQVSIVAHGHCTYNDESLGLRCSSR